jgi:hypothetical protein
MPSGVDPASLISNPEDVRAIWRGERQGRDVGTSDVTEAALLAVDAGAKPPLEFVGMGMTGIVFCEEPPHGYAYKVARSPQAHRTLAEEAEWLATADSIPEVRPLVARIVRWDQRRGIIVRECVRGRVGTWGLGKKVNDIYDRVAPFMLAEGWTMPELKGDSVVFDSQGRGKIVDASMPTRISNRLLGWVEDILEGRREREEYENDSTLAYYIRREFGQKEKMDEARAYKILDRLYALGARR